MMENNLRTFLGPYGSGNHHSSYIISTIIPDRMDYWRNDATVEPEIRAAMINIGNQLREVSLAQLLGDWATLTQAYHRSTVRKQQTKSLKRAGKQKVSPPHLRKVNDPNLAID